MDFFAEKILIIRGEYKAINLFFLYEDSGRPFSLVGATEIKVAFAKTGSVLTKKLTVADVSIVGAPELGQVLVQLQAAETADLKICKEGGLGSDFTAEVAFASGSPKRFNFKGILFVEDPSVVPA